MTAKKSVKHRAQGGVFAAARVMVLVCAFGLLVFSVVQESPVTVLQDASMLASSVVGMSAGVEPNPVNTLAAQLQAKQESLAQREARLAEIEQEIAYESRAGSINLGAFMSLLASFILFVLVGINFYLDSRRRGTTSSERIVVIGK